MAAVLDRGSQGTGFSSVDAAAVSVCGTIGNLLGPASANAAISQPNGTNMTSSQVTDQENMRLRVSEQAFLETRIYIYLHSTVKI